MDIKKLDRVSSSIDQGFDNWVIDTIDLIKKESDSKKKKTYTLNLMKECVKKGKTGISPPIYFTAYMLNCFDVYLQSLDDDSPDNLKKAFNIDGRVSAFEHSAALRMIVSEYVIGFKKCLTNREIKVTTDKLNTSPVLFSDNLDDCVQYARAHGFQVANNTPKLALNKARLVTLIIRLLRCKKTKAHYIIDKYEILELIKSPIELTLTSEQ